MADVLIYKLAQDIIAACDLVLTNSTGITQRQDGSLLVPSKLVGKKNSTEDDLLLAMFGADPTFSRQWLHPFYVQILDQPWTYVNTSITFYSPSALFNKAPSGLAYHCLYENGTTAIIADEFIFSERTDHCTNFKVKKQWDPKVKSRSDFEYEILVPECSKGKLILDISWSWAAVAFGTTSGDPVVTVNGEELIDDHPATNGLYRRFYRPSSLGSIPPGSRLDICNRVEGWTASLTKHLVFVTSMYTKPIE